MTNFSELPYEIRLSILETSAKQSFQSKINRFEKIFKPLPKPYICEGRYLFDFHTHEYTISKDLIKYCIKKIDKSSGKYTLEWCESWTKVGNRGWKNARKWYIKGYNQRHY